MRKGEIARYEHFLLFPQCFQKACFPGASKGVIVWEWINPFPTHFEAITNSKKLQMTTEMWLLKDFQMQIAHCGKR